jgi:hypothetical protein
MRAVRSSSTWRLLTLLTDFAEGMHDPLAELTKVFVESKHGSNTEPLHHREAGTIHKTESLVWVLAEDGPSPFFVGWSNRTRGVVASPNKRSPNCRACSYPSRIQRKVMVS